MKRKILIFVKVLLVLLILICLSWVCEVFQAASNLPWYKLLGAGALFIVGTFLLILAIKEDSDRQDRERRHIVVEVEFDYNGEVDKYFRRAGLNYQCDRQDFVRRAAISAAYEENKKDRE